MNLSAPRAKLDPYIFPLFPKNRGIMNEYLEGHDKKEATKYIENKSIAEKNELLFSCGMNFNELPNWQKRGVGLYWIKEEKTGYNPKDNIEVKAKRKMIKIDYDLPMRDEYSNFISKILENSKSGHVA